VNKLLEEFNAYFTSANDVDMPERVSVPVAEWRKLYESLTTPKPHFSAWRRGDILRVIYLEPGVSKILQIRSKSELLS